MWFLDSLQTVDLPYANCTAIPRVIKEAWRNGASMYHALFQGLVKLHVTEADICQEKEINSSVSLSECVEASQVRSKGSVLPLYCQLQYLARDIYPHRNIQVISPCLVSYKTPSTIKNFPLCPRGPAPKKRLVSVVRKFHSFVLPRDSTALTQESDTNKSEAYQPVRSYTQK